MENQTEKNYKSKKCVREAMKRYKTRMKEQNPEKYTEFLEAQRARCKEYYKKVKEERAQLKQILEKLNKS